MPHFLKLFYILKKMTKMFYFILENIRILQTIEGTCARLLAARHWKIAHLTEFACFSNHCIKAPHTEHTVQREKAEREREKMRESEGK